MTLHTHVITNMLATYRGDAKRLKNCNPEVYLDRMLKIKDLEMNITHIKYFEHFENYEILNKKSFKHGKGNQVIYTLCIGDKPVDILLARNHNGRYCRLWTKEDEIRFIKSGISMKTITPDELEKILV